MKDDGFPDKLCAPCRTTINDSYVLQQKCKNNQQLLCGVLNITIAADPVESHKPKVCLTIGTQTDAEQKAKGENAKTQTDWDTFTVCTQTVSHDPKSIHTQTLLHSVKSIGSQTTTESKCSTFAAECQTDEWIPITIPNTTDLVKECSTAAVECQTEEWPTNVNAESPREPFRTLSVTSTEPEVLEDGNDEFECILTEVADILEDDEDEYEEQPQIKSETVLDISEEQDVDDDEHEVEERQEEPLLEEAEYLFDEDNDDTYEVTFVESTKSARSYEEIQDELKADDEKEVNPKKRKRR